VVAVGTMESGRETPFESCLAGHAAASVVEDCLDEVGWPAVAEGACASSV
jgi:hypothetical protein